MQVVGHPDLHGWDNTSPPLIGDIVAAVIQEFGRDNEGVSSSTRDQVTTSWRAATVQQPAGFSAQPTPGTFGPGNPIAGSGGVTGIATSGQGRTHLTGSPPGRGREAQPKKARQPKHHTPIPAIPASFSALQGLSTEKLSRLLDDDSARQALLLGMASVVQMKDLRTDVRKGNVETARLTLSKQDTATSLRQQGEAMKMELKRLQISYEGISSTSLSILHGFRRLKSKKWFKCSQGQLLWSIPNGISNERTGDEERTSSVS